MDFLSCFSPSNFKKNRIARRQMWYFGLVIVVFCLFLALCFFYLLQQQTVALKKNQMQAQSRRLSWTIQRNLPLMERLYGDRLAHNPFLNFLDDVTPGIVWVVDSNRELSMNVKFIERLRQKDKEAGRVRERPLPNNRKEAYQQLSPKVKEAVEEAFQGQDSLVEEYDKNYREDTLTMVTPIKNKAGQTRAVLLVQALARGVDETASAAIRVLLISALVACLIIVVLIVPMSWHITNSLNKMRQIALRLADKDYSARCQIKQEDEIGELAATLDTLAVRLAAAEKESLKLEQLRKDFFSNISHELRTPVTVIRSSLEALVDGVVTEPGQVAAYRSSIIKETKNLERLIDDLLEYSRLQNLDYKIEKGVINFCDVLQDAARAAQQLGREKQLAVELRLDREVYLLEGDYGRLRQLLLIFVNNSVKFSPAGSKIEMALVDRELRLTDHGQGMSAEALAHAFDKFYKQRSEENKEGSGLGLAIAKQIALRHHMDLEIASQLGSFTTIIVKLPPPLAAEAADAD